MADKWVAITGCNGYIGGQTALRFKDLGYKVLGVDRNATSPWINEQLDQVIKGDFTNAIFINSFIDKNPVALIHIAGSSLVGPSMTDPAPYYANNVGGTAKLLAAVAERGWHKTVVFSSSAAVYGEPQVSTLTESSPTIPLSPYGHSKLMAEQVLRDCAKGYGFKTIALRYFNACGADSNVRHGQLKAATHVIARILETIVNKGVFTLNGTDYPTPDGTCVRDYLHVEDIAQAHFLATKYSESAESGTSLELNLGTGKGVSITEIINSVERITGRTVLVHKGPGRAGDPATLVAYAAQAKKIMGWYPVNSSIDNIVKTAWAWYNSAEYRGRA
jgi:UDP-glucose-4-epimerase GalE